MVENVMELLRILHLFPDEEDERDLRKGCLKEVDVEDVDDDLDEEDVDIHKISRRRYSVIVRECEVCEKGREENTDD